MFLSNSWKKLWIGKVQKSKIEDFRKSQKDFRIGRKKANGLSKTKKKEAIWHLRGETFYTVITTGKEEDILLNYGISQEAKRKNEDVKKVIVTKVDATIDILQAVLVYVFSLHVIWRLEKKPL